MSAARSSPSATRSSRSIPSRALRRNPSTKRAPSSRTRIREANAGFEKVRLTLSFRSTNDVLHAVDRVFADPEARRGITHDPDPVRHDAIRHDAPGYVEVWPSVGAELGRGARRLDAGRSTTPRRRRCRSPRRWRRRSSIGSTNGEIIEGNGQAADAGRRHGAGAQARPLRACAVAQPEEQEHRRSPAPTG